MNECNTIEIVQGEDRVFVLKLTSVSCDSKEPYDLSNVTAIKGVFKGMTPVNVELTLAASEIAILGSPFAGKLQFTMSDTKSALLKCGTGLSFEVELDEGANKRIVQVRNLLSVNARV